MHAVGVTNYRCGKAATSDNWSDFGGSMYQSNIRSAAHRGCVALCALLLPGFALAQAATDTKPKQTVTEEIIVTGSRIPEPNMVSVSSIQVVGAEDIKISGRNDINDVLQLLPPELQQLPGPGPWQHDQRSDHGRWRGDR